jgi:hypothetical protein
VRWKSSLAAPTDGNLNKKQFSKKVYFFATEIYLIKYSIFTWIPILDEKRRNEMTYFISSRLISLLACGQNNVEGMGGGGGFASLRSQTDSVSHDKTKEKRSSCGYNR